MLIQGAHLLPVTQAGQSAERSCRRIIRNNIIRKTGLIVLLTYLCKEYNHGKRNY